VYRKRKKERRERVLSQLAAAVMPDSGRTIRGKEEKIRKIKEYAEGLVAGARRSAGRKLSHSADPMNNGKLFLVQCLLLLGCQPMIS
jgi:hypothetical protein